MNRHAIACLWCALMVSAVLITAGCTGTEDAAPAPAAIGDTVRVHYTGTLDSGEIFDSSLDREPLEFTLGAGSMIPAFEDAIIGMSAGEEKAFTIMAADAYGPGTLELDRDCIVLQEEPQVGRILRMVTEEGRVIEVAVAAMDETTITVRNTHPLAGKNLTFSVQLVEIADGA